MGYSVQQNAVSEPLTFTVVDAADSKTGLVGLANADFTITLSKHGAAAVAGGGVVTARGAGGYSYWTVAGDLDTAGILDMHVEATGADQTDERYFVTVSDPTNPTPSGAGTFIAQMQARGFGSGLTAGQWNQVYVDALAMYSRHRPRTIIGTIATTAGVESYALPTNGYLCQGVAPWLSGSYWADESLPLEAIIMQEQVGEAFVYSFSQPSLASIYHANLEAAARSWGESWVQDDFGGAIRLIPVPQTAETLAVLYTAPHADDSTVPAAEYDLLLKAGNACALGALVVSGAVSVIGAGGSLTLGPYKRDVGGMVSVVTALATKAKDAEQAFLDSARGFAPAQRY